MTTKIDWCDMTWNPVWGCLNKCEYCYAFKIAKRFYRQVARKENKISIFNIGQDEYEILTDKINRFIPVWLQSNYDKKFPHPIKKPSRIFVNSMSDIEHWKPEWIKKVLEKIKKHPQHKFLFLTKNPEVYKKYSFPENCWLGATITNQKDTRKIIETLDEVIVKIKFLSLEPLLEYINLSPYLIRSRCAACKHTTLKLLDKCEKCGAININFSAPINWVICGGMTGQKAKPMHPDWVRSLRDQCASAEVPFFFKSWGEWIGGLYGSNIPDCLGDKVNNNNYFYYFDNPPCKVWKVGKKKSGYLLDNKEHREFPKI